MMPGVRAAMRYARQGTAFGEPVRSNPLEDLNGFESLKTSGARWRGSGASGSVFQGFLRRAPARSAGSALAVRQLGVCGRQFGALGSMLFNVAPSRDVPLDEKARNQFPGAGLNSSDVELMQVICPTCQSLATRQMPATSCGGGNRFLQPPFFTIWYPLASSSSITTLVRCALSSG